VRELVIRGWYRLTRKPVYVGLVPIALGPVAAFALPANLFAPVALATWLHFRFVLPEASWLRERFAEAFDAYAAPVPRWLIAIPDVRPEAE
jgi:protein-S-isoprenylcysteine O-methyltransferase Ste14